MSISQRIFFRKLRWLTVFYYAVAAVGVIHFCSIGFTGQYWIPFPKVDNDAITMMAAMFHLAINMSFLMSILVLCIEKPTVIKDAYKRHYS